MPRFVPSRVGHLARELADLYEPHQQREFYELTRVVEGLYHHYRGNQARVVDDLYAPFDPDAETLPPSGAAGDDPLGTLFEQVGLLLERANFEPVSHEDLLTASDREVLARLHIDPDFKGLERVAVWRRGLGTKAVTLRPVRKLFRRFEEEIPTYRRVIVLVRTHSEPHVLVRLFKDVPVRDLELLLPTVQVKMKLFDKLKLSGSGSAAAISAWKLLKMIYTYMPSLAKLLAVPFKILFLPLFAIVGAIYGGKTILDYTKIRSSYVTALAEHLYAITMASNRAAIFRVGAMAGAEESKELLISYGLLSQAGETGVTLEQLKARAEAFVWDRYRARVEFDASDALNKLDDLELVERDGERLRARSLRAALENVDACWDELYAA